MRAIPWYRRCSWIFLFAHSVLVFAAFVYVASCFSTNQHVNFVWTWFLLVEIPTGWVGMFLMAFATHRFLEAGSNGVFYSWTIAPLIGFGLFGGAQWFVIGHLIDRWQSRWWPPGTCPQCGYNLTGNVTGRCPECGTCVRHVQSEPPSTQDGTRGS
jgi:hypothetical protein